MVAVGLAAVVLAAAGNAAGGLTATFADRSYAPGQAASLWVTAPPGPLTVQVLQAGPEASPGALGVAVDDPLRLVWRGGSGTIAVRLWHWPSGLYFARVASRGSVWFAPFVLRPTRLGEHRVAVVLPTNTWQAYNDFGGGSWYFGGPETVDLARPYLDHGVPPHYREYDRGFLRWLAQTGKQVDVLADDDLERIKGPAWLAARYDLIVFPGHEEYVTPHVYDLVRRYRDTGGNLMFLSANNFFYRVIRNGSTITRSGRWRDLGRPESALVGVQYAGWDEAVLPNRPYVVTDTSAAPWLFRGTGLHDGSVFGKYGIEIDDVTPDSPPGTLVLAQIPDDFGPGQSAEMTYYERGGAKVFAAGVMNFGATSGWPVVSKLMENLWARLSTP